VNTSFAISNSIDDNNRVKLAREICQIDCDIYDLDRRITLKKAVGEPESSLKYLRGIQDDYLKLYDSLKTNFQLAIHNNPQDFTNESRSNVWYFYGQYFLAERGISLNVNQRYHYFNNLPTGRVSLENNGNYPQDSLIGTYWLDSSAVFIFDHYFPLWKGQSIMRIKRWEHCINVFGKLCKEFFIPMTWQTELMNCGPTCLKMVLEDYGTYLSLEHIGQLADLDESGTSFGDLTRAALQLNIATENYKTTYDELLKKMHSRVIVHWENKHFVMVYAMDEEYAWIADPDWGRIKYSRKDFCDKWLYGTEKTTEKGSVLTFTPMASFYE
jgi:ATP-binding cassette subfamily B protein